jgi:hypothetical protein
MQDPSQEAPGEGDVNDEGAISPVGPTSNGHGQGPSR